MTVNYKLSFEDTNMRKFLQTVHYSDYIQNLPENIKCNTLTMKMFECIAPTYIDPLADSGVSTSLFDFNTFVNAPYSNDLCVGDEYKALLSFYNEVYGSRVFSSASDFSNFKFGSTIVVPEVTRFATIKFLGQMYTSTMSRTTHGSYIEIFIELPTPNKETRMKAGEVQYFFSHHLQNESRFVADGGLYTPRLHTEHVFAFVRWFKPSKHLFKGFENLGAAYYHDSFTPMSSDCILPISKIYSCAAMKKGYPDNHIVFVPMPRKIVGL
ncbi:hypothetical protein G6F56_010179 [Rhizopus delemar]|nr:hypothetical protein G6F56_010179 [Rhizopus delemar]